MTGGTEDSSSQTQTPQQTSNLTNQDQNPSNQNSKPKNTPCPHCPELCMGTRGLAIHISKRHKTIRRGQIVSQYTTNNTDASRNDNSKEPTTAVENSDVEHPSLKVIKENLDVLLEREEKDSELLEALMSALTETLTDLQDKLSGPKNPTSRYYAMRKTGAFQKNDRKFSQSNNPERQYKRDRTRRKEKHNYEKMQWLYYNQRKKAVRLLSKSNSESCEIDLKTLHSQFSSRWSSQNKNVIPKQPLNPEQQLQIDADHNKIIDPDEVKAAITKLSSDSSGGPDRIIPRTVKFHSKIMSKILAVVLTIMLKWNYVPNSFRNARTILIFKGGDSKLAKNWRPITVCSVLRRIVEKVIDKRLRDCLTVNPNQTGFTNQPGTFINSTIIDGCLKSAKSNKSTCVVVFLDVSCAFDAVGHDQTDEALKCEPVPSDLRNLTSTLMRGNKTQIHTKHGQTKEIELCRGVMQGAPTSPQLFNLSTRPVLDELSEEEIVLRYGFEILPNVRVSNKAFADDTGLVGNSRKSAVTLVNMAISKFADMGLEINVEKSVAIIIEEGKLSTDDLVLDNSNKIRAIKSDETIRYLGVTFSDEILFNKTQVIQNLQSQLENIVSTSTLRADQKLQIINQYIFPTLAYPFQTAPLNKLKKKFLQDVDKIIRHAVKEILQIPDDTPNNMLYSCIGVKGLSLIKAEWEAYIQNINACYVLISANDDTVNKIRNLDAEIELCLGQLNLDSNILQNLKKAKPSKILRTELREKEYQSWCNLNQKGRGVALFQECPAVNKLIHSKIGLSCSEWITSLKMVGNVTSVRIHPGRNSGNSRCRILGCDEFETLPHVLGSCRHGELLRNDRHNKIVNLIAEELKANPNMEVHVELPCTSSDGIQADRRVDILAFEKRSRKGYIIDPTIRFEGNHTQAEDVNSEKKRIYEPCIPDLTKRFNLKEVKVIGLLIGARGTITKFFEDFRIQLGLPVSLRDDVVIEALRGSHRIYHHHVYDPGSKPNALQPGPIPTNIK